MPIVAQSPKADDILQAALRYARLGLHVIPLCGKRPILEDWPERATTDEGQIREWFGQGGRNVGIVCGARSRIFVLDVDLKNAGQESLDVLVNKNGALPETWEQITGGGGRHYLFRYPGFHIPNIVGLRPGLDIRGDGGQIVAAPSIHPDTGKSYDWDGIDPIERQPLADSPPWLLALIQTHAKDGRRPAASGGKIPKGQQQYYLVRLAGSMRNQGAEFPEIFEALKAANQNRCTEPGSEKNIRQIAESICKYPPGKVYLGPEEPPAAEAVIRQAELAAPEPGRLEAVIAAYRRWFYLPDPGPLQVALGAIIANYLPGNPVWLLLVSPTGGGKTEILMPMAGLPRVCCAATITEAALLSGVSRKDTAKNATGGLLREVGAFGILLLKDFTSILSMDRMTRGPLLAALREVYDGSWTRYVGTDGGKSLSWEGKLGLLAGCTPTIDRHYAVMACLGERFVTYRMTPADQDQLTDRALFQTGRQKEIHTELRAKVSEFWEGLALPEQLPELEAAEREYLIALSTFVVRCRSGVERDGYTREIELVPDAEVPGRLAITLAQLLGSFKVAGLDADRRLALIRKVGLDSVPALRWRVLELLANQGQPMATAEIATRVGHPTGTTRRALEDLTAHTVLTRTSVGQGKSDLWTLTEWAEMRYRAVQGPFPRCGGPQ